MNAKEIVAEYYNSGVFRSAETLDRFIHNDLDLQWHSSKGFLQIDKNDYYALIAEMRKSYSASRLDISHILSEGDTVTVRYTHYVNAIENPNEEMMLAHFVVIWEVKDDKLYKGFLMSQLG